MATSNKYNHDKPISSVWFYAGSLFWFALGFPLAFMKPQNVPLPLRVLGFLFALPGVLLLLEPLHRMGTLPRIVENWYKGWHFMGFARKLTFHADAVSSYARIAPLILGGIAILLIVIRPSNPPAFLLFFTITLAFQFVLSMLSLLSGLLRRRVSMSSRMSGLMSKIESLSWALVRASATTPVAIENVSLWRLVASVGFQASIFGSAIIVATQLPSGQMLGPIMLSLIILGAAGTNVLLSETNRERSLFESELRTAHDMQMGLMPAEDPQVLGFDISGLCRPASEVGGDYFDYVWLDEQKTRLGIAVADVSGKAMKAAITAVMTSGMVYREVGTNETPKGILRKINRPIYLKTDKRIFAAMSFAVIDTKSKEMTFSNAGQMQPLLRRDGQIKALKVEGARLPLGLVEDVEYSELSLTLRSGDMVVFYTDGIPEAMNGKNEMLGFERLEVIVNESSGDDSAKQVAATIVAKAAEFAGSALQHDDMTVVVVRVL